jgi:uncharacterized protein
MNKISPMVKLLFTLFLLTIISSCAFNKMFLHPFPLKTTDSFSDYNDVLKDTLTLTFNANQTPVVKNSKNEPADLSYSIENIHFANQQEDTLNAWFIKPNENYNGITLYFLHGNAGNMVYNYLLMEPFVRKGFQVFMIDYSGFGFSQGKSKRKYVLTDGKDGLDYLLSRTDIKYNKLIIYGQSLGGHLAAVSGTQNQDKIDGLVLEGAFSSHKDAANDRVPFLSRLFVREMYSAEKNIKNYKKPLLIIHSTEDKTIPYKHAERLFQLATTEKELYTIDGRHVYGPLLYGDSIAQKLVELVQ